MKTFSCSCSNTLYFPNSQCINCHAELGFNTDTYELTDVYLHADGYYYPNQSSKPFKKCKNYSDYQVCNWMVDAQDPSDFCLSCRLTSKIPNLAKEGNIQRWYKMEDAKRRLLDSLLKLDLPFLEKSDNGKYKLGFAFLEDQVEDTFGDELTIKEYIMTGHSNGLITINLDEADPSKRLKMREQLGESYRTLLGHFRHESGHFFWDLLVKNTHFIDEFRQLFGDETLDYQSALQTYYARGPMQNWQEYWISAYASMHPWEDWAESWAHYLHMVDTLETANAFNFSINQKELTNPLNAYHPDNSDAIEEIFTKMFADWCELSSALNALNRSMGLDDAYPFVISNSALQKLRFVHKVIQSSANHRYAQLHTKR